MPDNQNIKQDEFGDLFSDTGLGRSTKVTEKHRKSFAEFKQLVCDFEQENPCDRRHLGDRMFVVAAMLDIDPRELLTTALREAGLGDISWLLAATVRRRKGFEEFRGVKEQMEIVDRRWHYMWPKPGSRDPWHVYDHKFRRWYNRACADVIGSVLIHTGILSKPAQRGV